MDGPPSLVVFPMAPLERDLLLVREEAEPAADPIAITGALLRRERVINPVVGDGVIAEVAALWIRDDLAIAPLLNDDVRVFFRFPACRALDQISEAAVHEVLGNGPRVGNVLDVA